MLPAVLNYESIIEYVVLKLEHSDANNIDFNQCLDMLLVCQDTSQQNRISLHILNNHLETPDLYLAFSSSEYITTLSEEKLNFIESVNNSNISCKKAKAAATFALAQYYSIVITAKKTAILLEIDFKLYFQLITVGMNKEQELLEQASFLNSLELSFLEEEFNKLLFLKMK